MLIKVESKLKVWLKMILIFVIFTIILIQFRKLFSDFDIHTFYLYRDKLSFVRLIIITILWYLTPTAWSTYFSKFSIISSNNFILNLKEIKIRLVRLSSVYCP